MTNTTLNADDEIDKYLFDTWNMKDTVHNRAMADGVKKWRKKHELQARLKQASIAHEKYWRIVTIEDTESFESYLEKEIAELKQELEKL